MKAPLTTSYHGEKNLDHGSTMDRQERQKVPPRCYHGYGLVAVEL